MCGIAGLAGYGDAQSRTALVRAMIACLRHRGPDADAVVDDSGVCLGHARLSVIDVASGGQPMRAHDGPLSIVFNGEIYNYVELREELAARGRRFVTNSDTEVLLAAYAEWSTACLAKLRGMFAFVIHDARSGDLFGARDRFGKKPLLYYRGNGVFAFASELKALLRLPFVDRAADPAAIVGYLEQLYVPADRCAVAAVEKLPPGHSFTWRDGALSVQEYWSPRFVPDERLTYPDALEALRGALREAVRIRLRSDVPLGVFLSGGIDSSLVAVTAAELLSRPLNTYSVRMQGLPDETPYAAEVAAAIGSAHTLIEVPSPDASDIEDTAALFDEPFADSSAVPMSMMSKRAKEHVTVVLSGDGGDELFGGYGIYQRHLATLSGESAGVRASPRLRALRAVLPPAIERYARRLAHRAAPLVAGVGQRKRSGNILQAHCDQQQIHYEPALASLLQRDARDCEDAARSEQREAVASGRDDLETVFEVDVRHYLAGDILAKVDMTTMAWGLEARAPLLDPEVARVGLAMPASMKLSRTETKRPLKDLLAPRMGRGFVDRPKMGFGAPLDSWLASPSTRALVHDILGAARLRAEAWLNPAGVKQLVQRFYDGRTYLAQQVWTVLMLEIWARRYL